jgi:DNA-binding NtrC family response regulator
MMTMRILDVGQCGMDGPEITELLSQKLGAKVDRAATATDARRKLDVTTYDLVLVNRVLAADGSSGIDLIDELVRDGSGAPVMLVSDRQDAQKAAIAKGAIRGFGKAELDDAKTFDLIKNAARSASK